MSTVTRSDPQAEQRLVSTLPSPKLKRPPPLVTKLQLGNAHVLEALLRRRVSQDRVLEAGPSQTEAFPSRARSFSRIRGPRFPPVPKGVGHSLTVSRHPRILRA